MKCSHPETKYAIVNGNRTSIHDYKGTIPYCEKGHELIGVQGKHNQWHFRHKNTDDVSGELSEWHREWQRHFDSIEVCFEKMEGQIKARRADIVEGYNVVEIQHSSLSKEEVELDEMPTQHRSTAGMGSKRGWASSKANKIKNQTLKNYRKPGEPSKEDKVKLADLAKNSGVEVKKLKDFISATSGPSICSPKYSETSLRP
jgi:hypothetical protein